MDPLQLRAAPHRFRSAQDVVLVATALSMAVYEMVEMWLLEAPRGARFTLAIALHSLQVGVILAVVWVVLRAWRDKTVHEQALGRMVEKVIFAQEQERRRIACDLHDAVSPLIVSAKQHAETSRDLGALDAARSASELARGIQRLDEAIVETRQMLRALRPSSVDANGLAPAVSRYLDEVAQEAGWAVHFEENLGDDRLPAAVETAAFRIVQEAIANASKYARSSRIEVALRRDPRWIELDVRDHGVGFSSDAPSPRGFGLISMRERAVLLGGECAIDSQRGVGTQVRVRLPLPAERAR